METTERTSTTFVTCDECGRLSTLEALLTQRPVAASLAHAQELGLQCPKCGTFVYSHYTSERLNPFKKRLDTALAHYQEHRTQANWREVQRAKKRHQVEHDRLTATVEKAKLTAGQPKTA